MRRAVINVATTPYYQRGQARLWEECDRQEVCTVSFPPIPKEWPSHQDKPYGFKAYAMKAAANNGFDLLLWADACILPIRDMMPLWERIEQDGYWMSANGFTNYEWTADSAYPNLFPEMERGLRVPYGGKIERLYDMATARDINRKIPHVVATTFGLNVRHELGRKFLDEYYRLASETRAFCGPWRNWNHEDTPKAACDWRTAPCGPADVRGHRHDQTAASVIAWRLGFKLTSPPDVFCYGKAGDVTDERTILLADGSYV